MPEEKIFEDLKSYILELNNMGIKKIAFAATDEKRAESVGENKVDVMRVVKADLLAYRDAVIFKCSLSNIDLDAVYEELVSSGFEVKKTNRNIT